MNVAHMETENCLRILKSDLSSLNKGGGVRGFSLPVDKTAALYVDIPLHSSDEEPYGHFSRANVGLSRWYQNISF